MSARRTYPKRVRSEARARRTATNLPVGTHLLARIRETNANPYAPLEQCRLDDPKTRRSDQWLAENRDAIGAYNERVRAIGVFSNGLRRF